MAYVSWTRDTLVAELRVLTDQPHVGILTAPVAVTLINNAYRELLGKICQRNYRYFLTSASISTVTGSKFVTLPIDCVAVYKITDSDGGELSHRDMETFGTSTDAQEPTHWAKVGNKIIFPDVADAIHTYTLWYHAFPGDMLTGAAIPEFVPGFEDLIATLAAIKSKMIRDDKADFMALYPDRLQAMLNAAGTEQTASSRRVRRSVYWDLDL